MADFPIAGEHRQRPHGVHHPPRRHSCEGCLGERERNRGKSVCDHDATPAYRRPPDGWSDMGSHIDQPDVRLEFSSEIGEDGLPLWERPIDQEASS